MVTMKWNKKQYFQANNITEKLKLKLTYEPAWKQWMSPVSTCSYHLYSWLSLAHTQVRIQWLHQWDLLAWFCEWLYLLVQLNMPQNSSYMFRIHVHSVMQRHVQGFPKSFYLSKSLLLCWDKIVRPGSDNQRMSGILKMWLLVLSECQRSWTCGCWSFSGLSNRPVLGNPLKFDSSFFRQSVTK